MDIERLEKEQGSKWSKLKKRFQRDYNNLSLKKKVDINRSVQAWKQADILVTDLEVTDDGIKNKGSYYV